MEDHHFIAERLPLNDGFTWTLPSRLGGMLADLESAYGPRDREYTILGIEFGPGTPQLWYPGNRKQIVIQLARNALPDSVLACYQLAHEAVHLLAPTGGRQAPVIEEGLATCYAEDYVLTHFEREILSGVEAYDHASALVRQLIDIDAKLVKRLRLLKPSFSTWQAKDIQRVNPNIPPALAEKLVEPFLS